MLSARTKQNGGKATAWPSRDEDGSRAKPEKKKECSKCTIMQYFSGQ